MKIQDMFDILIIGGGASGMAAAIEAMRTRSSLRIAVLEKNSKVGRKVLASGNGRCNLSNRRCEDVDITLDFFESIGVYTRSDAEGRLFPYNRKASTVVDALLREAERLGISVFTDVCVTGISLLPGEGFEVESGLGCYSCKELLMACGGKAGPVYGTTGDGYGFARSVGHSVTRLAPALTSIEYGENISLPDGYRAPAGVTLLRDGEVMSASSGEIQLAEGVVSGICVLDLSRDIILDEGESMKDGFPRYSLSVDFLQDMDKRKATAMLKNLCAVKGITVWDVVASFVSAPLARDIVMRAGFDPADTANAISEDRLGALIDVLKGWTITVKSLSGWQKAQCTRGGIPCSEFNMDTMESKIVAGLYFSGEIIDKDGPCGGYNLNNAWITGLRAGKAMAEGL